MLGLMKLGAVVMPTTTAVGSAELADRIERGAARAVICESGDASKVDDVPGDYLRIAVGSGDTRPGWLALHDAYQQPEGPWVNPGDRERGARGQSVCGRVGCGWRRVKKKK